MIRIHSFLLSLIPLAFSVLTANAAILNGDFSSAGVSPDPFQSWETDLLFGDRPTDGGGVAEFTVTDGFGDQQLQQWFTLSSDAMTLSFEYSLSIASGGTSGSLPDSFQATLFDTSFNPLFPSGDPFFFPGYFSVDNDGTEFFDATYVSVQDVGAGVRRVSLDVSSLSSQDLLLEFLALGSDDGFQTTVRVDDVAVAAEEDSGVIPEPASLLVWGGIALGGAFLAGRRRRSRVAA